MAAHKLMAKVAVEQVYSVRLVRVMALFGFNAVAGLRCTHKFSVCIGPSSGVEEEEVANNRLYDEVLNCHYQCFYRTLPYSL